MQMLITPVQGNSFNSECFSCLLNIIRIYITFSSGAIIEYDEKIYFDTIFRDW